MCIFFDILRFLVENKIKQKNQYGRSEPLGTGVQCNTSNVAKHKIVFFFVISDRPALIEQLENLKN